MKRRVLSILLAIIIIGGPLLLLLPAPVQAAYTGYAPFGVGTYWNFSNDVALRPEDGMNIGRLSDGSYVCFAARNGAEAGHNSSLFKKEESAVFNSNALEELWFSANNYDDAVLCVDSSDDIHVAAFRTPALNELVYMRFNPDGTLAEGPTVLDSDVGSIVPSPVIAVDGNDYIYVVWQDDHDAGGDDDILSIRRTAPATWGSIETAVDGETYGYDQGYPDIWVDDGDDVWVVGHGKGHGGFTTVDSIWAIERDSVGGWQSLDVVRNENGFHHRYARGVMASDLEFHLVWQKTNASTNANTIYYKLSDDGGATWESSEEVSTNVVTADFCAGPSVTVGSSDEVIHVFWIYQYDAIHPLTREKSDGTWELYGAASTYYELYTTLCRWIYGLHSYYPIVNGQHTNIALTGAFASFTERDDYQRLPISRNCTFPMGDMLAYVNSGTNTAQSGWGTSFAGGTGSVKFVDDLTPNFSAIYQYELGLVGDASYYQIYVKDGYDFDAASTMWSTGWTSMTSISFGERCEDITYAGAALTADTTYYWLIQFRDSLGTPTKYSGYWNFVTCSFSCSYAGVSYQRLDYTAGGYISDPLDSCRASDGRIYIFGGSEVRGPAVSGAPSGMLWWTDDGGATWDCEQVEGCDSIANGAYNKIDYGAVAIDGDNKLHFIWEDDVEYKVFYNSRTSAGVWGTRYELFNYTSSYRANGCDIEIDGERNVHTWYAYYDSGNKGYVAYRKYVYPTGWIAQTGVWGGNDGQDGVYDVDGIVTNSSRADSDEYLAVKFISYDGYRLMFSVSTNGGTLWSDFDVPYELSLNDQKRTWSDWFYDPIDDEFIFFWQEMFDVMGTQFARPVTTKIALSYFDGQSLDVGNYHAVYATARGDNTTVGNYGPGAGLMVGQSADYGGPSDYAVWRTGMIFDTSDIPSGTVSAATLYYYCNYMYWGGSTNYDVTVVEGDGLANPIVASDYGDLFDCTTSYSTFTVSSQDLNYDAWIPFTLDAAGRTYVEGQLGGTEAFLGLRSDQDIANAPPAGNEKDYMASAGLAQYQPYLVLTVDGTEYTTFLCKQSETILDNPAEQIDTEAVTQQMQCVRNADDEWIFWFYNDNAGLADGIGMYIRVWDGATWSALTRTDNEEYQDIKVLYHEWPEISGVQTNIADYGFFSVRDGTGYYGMGSGGMWPPAPLPPTAPTALLCDSKSSPATNVTDFIPDLSAIFNDPNSGDIGDGYQIQVGSDNVWGASQLTESQAASGQALVEVTDSSAWTVARTVIISGGGNVESHDIASQPDATHIQLDANLTHTYPIGSYVREDEAEMWDTEPDQAMSNVNEGNRCDDITYAGSVLQPEQTYYWRICFWDDGGLPDPGDENWSATAQFTMGAAAIGAPTVLTLVATGITDTDATLHGQLSVDGDSPPSQYRFIYDTGPGYPYAYSTAWAGSISAPIDFSQGLGGTLLPGVTYYYRAQCRDGAGTGTGLELNFTTTAGAPTVLTQPPSDISITSAQMNAYLYSDGGEASTVRFQYGTTEDFYGASDDNDTEVHGNNWASEVFEAQDTYTATGIMVKLYEEGSPANDLNVELWTVSGGDPNVLIAGAAGTIDKDDVTTSTSGDWYYADFSGTASVVSGTDYAVVAYTSGGNATNCYHWFYDDDGGYNGTDAYQDLSADGGGTWTPDTGDDQMFALYSTWTSTTYAGSYTSGNTATLVIESFEAACPYRFRTQAQNSYGTDTGDTLTFITSEHMGKPTDLKALPSSSTSISLVWGKGDGAQKTKIMYNTGSYPALHTEGTQGYFGTGSSCTVTDLTPGTLYYFAAWSYAPGDNWAVQEPTTGFHVAAAGTDTDTVIDLTDQLWWQDNGYYDSDYLYNDTRSAGAVVDTYAYGGGTGTLELTSTITGQVATDDFYIEYRARAVSMTYAGVVTPETPFPPGDDPSWFLEPDNNALQYLPGRGVLEDFGSTLGMSVGVTMCILLIVLAVLIGFITYVATRNTLMAIAAVAIVLLFGLVVGVVPGWVFFLYILIGGGTGYVLSKGASI